MLTNHYLFCCIIIILFIQQFAAWHDVIELQRQSLVHILPWKKTREEKTRQKKGCLRIGRLLAPFCPYSTSSLSSIYPTYLLSLFDPPYYIPYHHPVQIATVRRRNIQHIFIRSSTTLWPTHPVSTTCAVAATTTAAAAPATPQGILRAKPLTSGCNMFLVYTWNHLVRGTRDYLGTLSTISIRRWEQDGFSMEMLTNKNGITPKNIGFIEKLYSLRAPWWRHSSLNEPVKSHTAVVLYDFSPDFLVKLVSCSSYTLCSIIER